jgi:oxygen-independent coproporphyrinogen-3 oxidase
VAQDAASRHRNFRGYTTPAVCDVVGRGVSAISPVGDSFSQNPRDLPAWEIALDRGEPPVWRGLELSFDDRVRADVIQQLMCHGSVDIDSIEWRHDVDFREYFADALARLAPLVADGLAEIGERRITATSRGRLLLRIIAMCFDNYLKTSEATPRPRYSRVI